MKEGNLSAKSFIDVGCGVPILPDFMKDLGCKDVHGLEYNASIVKLVQPHYPDIVLHEGDMMTYQEYGKYDILYTYNPFYDSQKMADALLVIMEQMKFGAVLYYNPVRISYQFLEKWGFEELPTDLYGFYKFTKGA
jgi:trans-aconitate methyltransferase